MTQTMIDEPISTAEREPRTAEPFKPARTANPPKPSKPYNTVSVFIFTNPARHGPDRRSWRAGYGFTADGSARDWTGPNRPGPTEWPPLVWSNLNEYARTPAKTMCFTLFYMVEDMKE